MPTNAAIGYSLLTAKGTVALCLTTVNVGCQDEAVVTQLADVAYGSCVTSIAMSTGDAQLYER